MRLNIFKKITHNWHIKILSLVLALILWIYVDSMQKRERFISVPVEVKNIPAEYIVSNGIPISVKVILKGKENRLALLDEKNVRAYVDLENSAKGEKMEIVRIDKNSIPQGISIKEINPRIINISIERIEKKLVQVMPVITHEPPDGYNFEDVITDPEEVLVKGPESLIKDIDTVYTKDIDIKSLTETTVKEVGLNIKDSRITLENDTAISVKIIIKEQYVVKRMYWNTIVLLNLNENFNAEIKDITVSVLLRIPKRIERVFSDEQYHLYVDCQNIDEPGNFHLPIIFETESKDITLIKTEPSSVDVIITGGSEP